MASLGVTVLTLGMEAETLASDVYRTARVDSGEEEALRRTREVLRILSDIGLVELWLGDPLDPSKRAQTTDSEALLSRDDFLVNVCGADGMALLFVNTDLGDAVAKRCLGVGDD